MVVVLERRKNSRREPLLVAIAAVRAPTNRCRQSWARDQMETTKIDLLIARGVRAVVAQMLRKLREVAIRRGISVAMVIAGALRCAFLLLLNEVLNWTVKDNDKLVKCQCEPRIIS